jgi:hypothetical protein
MVQWLNSFMQRLGPPLSDADHALAAARVCADKAARVARWLAEASTYQRGH